MDALQNYIQTQRQAGYSDEQIKQAILNQGYDEATASKALSTTTQSSEQQADQKETDTQETQTEDSTVQTPARYNPQQLQQYVYTYLQQGYQPQQLYDYLKGQGYTAHELNPAFSHIDKQYYKGQMPLEVIHQHHVGGGSLVKIGAMLVIVAVLIGGFFMYGEQLFGEPGEVILDLVAKPYKEIIAPGEPLIIEVSMVNQGGTEKANVDFEYDVRDRNTALIYEDSETRAFSSTLEFLAELDLPADTSEGQYEVTVIARYGNTPDKSKFVVTIAEDAPEEPPEETCTAESKTRTCSGECGPQRNNCDDLVDCGACEQEEETDKPDPVEKTNVKVDKTATDQAIFTQAIDATDAASAQSYCLEIKNEGYQTECLIVVAARTNTAGICEQIDDTYSKEDCYMGFVLSGDTSYCDQITLPENKQLCDQFVQLDLINSYLTTGDPGAKEKLGIPDKTPVDENDQPDPTLDDFFIGDVV